MDQLLEPLDQAKKTVGFFKALEEKWLTPEMEAMMKK